jgi:hypothetical protein
VDTRGARLTPEQAPTKAISGGWLLRRAAALDGRRADRLKASTEGQTVVGKGSDIPCREQ